MAEQNFSAALSTWKGKLTHPTHSYQLTGRDQPFRIAEVARFDSPRAGRESEREHGGKEEVGRADKGSVRIG
jgi:hypothetical protein